MIYTEQRKALQDLTIASLMSEGEKPLSMNGREINELHVPFEKEKSFYLLNFLQSNELGKYIVVKPQRKQFIIYLDDELLNISHHWFKDHKKVFAKGAASSFISYNAIIICISLFGSRRIEGVGITTTVYKNYIRTLAYCIEKTLHINVVLGNNQIKFPDVPELLLKTMNNISTFNSTEIANYLTSHEKTRLVEAIANKENVHYV